MSAHGSGRDQRQFGPHIELRAGFQIADLTALDAAFAIEQLSAFDIVCDCGAVCIGIEQAFEREPFRRIHLRIVILQRAFEARPVQNWVPPLTPCRD